MKCMVINKKPVVHFPIILGHSIKNVMYDLKAVKSGTQQYIKSV